VIDARTYSLLQDLVRRESRSLLQYVNDSFPWITPQEQDVLVEIQDMIEEESQGVAGLVRLLHRHRLTPPYLGSYPSNFTTLNYVTLDHLLPLLANHERQAISRLESEMPALADPEAREQARKILDMKRRHLQILENLRAAHPEPALR